MYQAIYDAIKEAKIITIFRHTKPDGDAYGSQMGLKEIIRDNFPEKEVYALGATNNHWRKIMGDTDQDVSDEKVQQSLAIVVDVGDIPRVDDRRFLTAEKIIKIDHHIFTESFGGLELIKTDFIAAAEIIADWAMKQNLKVSAKAATYLYCGIVTDSGRFQYEHTTPETFERAAFLLRRGVNAPALFDYIYQVDENDVRYTGYCRLNYQKTPHGVAYVMIPKETRLQFGIGENQGAGAVNSLANITGMKMHVFFVEKDDGAVKIEFRSKKLSVNEIAVKYGGGGHKLASGAVVADFNVARKVLADLEKECRDADEAQDE